MKRRTIYWITLTTGWVGYVALSGLINTLLGSPLDSNLIINLVTVVVLGIAVSHGYRELILRLGWKELGITALIPRILASSIVFGGIFHALYLAVISLLTTDPHLFDPTQNFQNVLSWILIFLIWSLIYFAFHFFRNYRKEEIKNLRWEASINEIELNKLKSQLNPHFMFNAMNSIRALVDEDPVKAKVAITQLSNILRTSLLMGKKKEISFDEELNLVKDYLGIEGARYEERLQVEFDIDHNSGKFLVPSLMIQTLVENGIKHGISQIPKGGLLKIATRVNNDVLHITISNDGQLDLNKATESGFGLKNTHQRLQLLYGDGSHFSIFQQDARVITEVIIPSALMQTDQKAIS